MRLTVIGCSGSLPGPDSAASCYLVEAGGVRLLLDLGSGALGPLQRYVDLDDLDAVLLSHLHPDHCLDLCGLYVARRYGPTPASTPLPVYGPTGTTGRIVAAYGPPDGRSLAASYDVRTWAPVTEIGPIRVRTARVQHPVETYAVRLEHDGRVLVFSGDTGPTEALVELARDCGLLLAEASFREGADNPPHLHLTGREAGEHAARAGAQALVLTHVPPWHQRDRAVDEAVTVYAGPVDAAVPGASYEC